MRQSIDNKGTTNMTIMITTMTSGMITKHTWIPWGGAGSLRYSKALRGVIPGNTPKIKSVNDGS